MSQNVYSEKVMEHFKNPKNMGEIEDPDAVGKAGNPVCGDQMEIYIKVIDNNIAEIKFKTFGCAAAIATSSMVTEIAKGKDISDAYQLSMNDVLEELEGLPQPKVHCSALATEALKDAIREYVEKKDINLKNIEFE